MTKLTITSTSELNAATGEYVMGYPRHIRDGKFYTPDTGVIGSYGLWEPTEDMNQALQVFRLFKCGHIMDCDDDVTVMLPNGGDQALTRHKSLGVAICLAALNAKGFDVECADG